MDASAAVECPDDGYSIGEDGRCIACARTPQEVLGEREQVDEFVTQPIPDDSIVVDADGAQRYVPSTTDSRIRAYANELAREHDEARAELGDRSAVNARAYDVDAQPLGIGESSKPVERPEREPSTEFLMRGPSTSGGGGGSKGRARTNRKKLICGEPCDCGSGLPCRMTTQHNSHSCEECRGGGGIGRPRTEPGVARNIHVTGRISEPTAVAIALTGKSTATIMYELAKAITEGRPYDWRNTESDN